MPSSESPARAERSNHERDLLGGLSRREGHDAGLGPVPLDEHPAVARDVVHDQADRHGVDDARAAGKVHGLDEVLAMFADVVVPDLVSRRAPGEFLAPNAIADERRRFSVETHDEEGEAPGRADERRNPIPAG